MVITALDQNDPRAIAMEVAGPAALLVAKLHKLGERQHTPDRLIDKDAHDVYRLLVATDATMVPAKLDQLRRDELSGSVTRKALVYLEHLFARGPDALGAMMAGRAEEIFGTAQTVRASVATLAADLFAALPTE